MAVKMTAEQAGGKLQDSHKLESQNFSEKFYRTNNGCSKQARLPVHGQEI
jgi:hypothetical protein